MSSSSSSNVPASPAILEALQREMRDLRAQMTANGEEARLRKEIAELKAALAAIDAKSGGAMISHLEYEAKLRRTPWLAELDDRRAKLKGYMLNLPSGPATTKALMEQFASVAKSGALDARDCVLVHSLLMPELFRFNLVKALLVNSSSSAWGTLFNTLVLGEGPAAFEASYGSVVVHMPWPLFPITGGFEQLNTDLIRETTTLLEGAPATIQGAGPKLAGKKTPKVFAPPHRERNERLIKIARGAGWAQVTDGRADLSEVEDAFNFMASQIAELRAEVASLRNAPPRVIYQEVEQPNQNRGGRGGRGNNRGRARGHARARGTRVWGRGEIEEIEGEGNEEGDPEF